MIAQQIFATGKELWFVDWCIQDRITFRHSSILSTSGLTYLDSWVEKAIHNN
jgi:hypothetical protein